MGKKKPNAIVGQSGGPTSVINATLAGVICGACGNVKKLYGMQNGILGLLKGEVVDLSNLFNNPRSISLLENTPGAILGSCRVRMPDDLDSALYKEIFDVLDGYGIGYFFYIGGNDSMDTVAKLSAYAKKISADVSIIGIPKTVDNDLVFTDHTPGFGSAAKYVATTACEIYEDISSYNIPSVTILEVMGRDTGWLGCACALPTNFFGHGCSLVYLPEAEFEIGSFLSDVERELRYEKPILIGVSEGVSYGARGDEGDSFGHRCLAGVGRSLEKEIKKQFKCKTRTVELNLPQRCATHIGSLTDAVESKRIGAYSVQMALEGKSGKMSAFVRHAGEYGVDITDVDAYLVANRVKNVPKEFINSENNFVTAECVEYLSPLILGERKVRFEKGLPLHFKLR